MCGGRGAGQRDNGGQGKVRLCSGTLGPSQFRRTGVYVHVLQCHPKVKFWGLGMDSGLQAACSWGAWGQWLRLSEAELEKNFFNISCFFSCLLGPCRDSQPERKSFYNLRRPGKGRCSGDRQVCSLPIQSHVCTSMCCGPRLLTTGLNLTCCSFSFSFSHIRMYIYTFQFLSLLIICLVCKC